MPFLPPSEGNISRRLDSTSFMALVFGLGAVADAAPLSAAVLLPLELVDMSYHAQAAVLKVAC